MLSRNEVRQQTESKTLNSFPPKSGGRRRQISGSYNQGSGSYGKANKVTQFRKPQAFSTRGSKALGCQSWKTTSVLNLSSRNWLQLGTLSGFLGSIDDSAYIRLVLLPILWRKFSRVCRSMTSISDIFVTEGYLKSWLSWPSHTHL